MDNPGQFGPTIRTLCWRANATQYAVSATGMPSVMTTMSGISASIASTIADLAKRGGTKITEA